VNEARRAEVLERYRVRAHIFQRASLRRGPLDRDSLKLIAEPSQPALSVREVEVLTLVAEGLTDAEIGGRLFIAPYTVKGHIKNLLSKLGASTRTHAVAIGFRSGLIS
jgi:DNA-binding CsgD family transcriptional regulator